MLAIQVFLPSCNPNITSDAKAALTAHHSPSARPSVTPAPTTPLAKVGIHQLAGAARAAFQTALVNSPPAAERERLRGLLREMREVEEALLEGEACP